MNAATLLERAGAELASVSRIELAGLLRRASRRRFARSAAAGLHPATRDVRDLHPRALRRDVRRELRRARSAGLALPPTVRRACVALATLPEDDWPAAALLARASLDLQDTESGRVALGRGLLAAGRHDEAESLLFVCFARGASRAEAWSICEGLGWAAEARRRGGESGARGDASRALAWYARAVRAGAPAEVCVSARAAAAELGDLARAERFERRLAARLAERPDERRRVRAVERERARAAVVPERSVRAPLARTA